MDVNQIMQQAQAMQVEMKKLQETLGNIEVDGTSGGGLVTVTITCKGEAQNVEIDPSVVDADDVETLEDLIVAAFNDAKKTADETLATETKKMMTKMGLPSNIEGMPF